MSRYSLQRAADVAPYVVVAPLPDDGASPYGEPHFRRATELLNEGRLDPDLLGWQPRPVEVDDCWCIVDTQAPHEIGAA